VVVLAAFALAHVSLLAGLALPVVRAVRQDPVAWFLLGALTAAWLGVCWVDHPSASQYYFLRSCTPIAAAALSWLIAIGVRGRDRRSMLWLSLTALTTGTVIAVVSRLVSRTPTGWRADQIETLAWPLLMAGGLAALAVVAWTLLGRRRFGLAGTGLAFALLVMVGLPIGTTAAQAWDAHDAPGSGHYASKFWRIHPDELAAAEWLAENSRPDDVVVTNTFCRPAGPPRPGCDARGYVISGVAGRRALLEGWAYTQQALGTHGVNGRKYLFQPSPWPDRVALVQQALTAPTPELFDRLRSQYGVRWLYADLRNGPVSPALDKLAVRRFEQSQVRVYELVAR
jgi:hypothetical protein